MYLNERAHPTSDARERFIDDFGERMLPELRKVG